MAGAGGGVAGFGGGHINAPSCNTMQPLTTSSAKSILNLLLLSPIDSSSFVTLLPNRVEAAEETKGHKHAAKDTHTQRHRHKAHTHKRVDTHSERTQQQKQHQSETGREPKARRSIHTDAHTKRRLRARAHKQVTHTHARTLCGEAGGHVRVTNARDLVLE